MQIFQICHFQNMTKSSVKGRSLKQEMKTLQFKNLQFWKNCLFSNLQFWRNCLLSKQLRNIYLSRDSHKVFSSSLFYVSREKNENTGLLLEICCCKVTSIQIKILILEVLWCSFLFKFTICH